MIVLSVVTQFPTKEKNFTAENAENAEFFLSFLCVLRVLCGEK